MSFKGVAANMLCYKDIFVEVVLVTNKSRVGTTRTGAFLIGQEDLRILPVPPALQAEAESLHQSHFSTLGCHAIAVRQLLNPYPSQVLGNFQQYIDKHECTYLVT